MKTVNVKKELEYMDKIAKINENKKLKYYIMTMGCQLNENDSEKLCGMLEKMNYTKTENMKEADLVLFNTCCVRENAEEKLFGKVGEVKKQKEEKGTIIAIGGCMMQEEHIIKKLKESYPYVDIIFGTHTLHKFPEDLYKALEENRKIRDILDIDGEVVEGLPISRNDKTKASVTIMNGCNNFCTYCIVPYVRGRERSRNPRDIIEEIRELAKQGYKEVTLLGQNVNSYLRVERENNIEFEEYDGVNSFATLLRAVNKIDGIDRIRFVSPHPKDFTDDVIEAIRDCDKVCKLVHLPLQSGSTEVLKRMNRKYTKEQYLNLVDKIREKIPNVIIRTTVMVGFPGETQEDFEKLCNFVESAKFDKLGAFAYSKEEGTPAAKLKEQVHPMTKKARYNKIMEIQQKVSEENLNKYIGKQLEVLVEGKTIDGKYYVCRSYMDVPDIDGLIYLNNSKELKIGDFVKCTIKSSINEYDLLGE